jgi:hypothetical protein
MLPRRLLFCVFAAIAVAALIWWEQSSEHVSVQFERWEANAVVLSVRNQGSEPVSVWDTATVHRTNGESSLESASLQTEPWGKRYQSAYFEGGPVAPNSAREVYIFTRITSVPVKAVDIHVLPWTQEEEKAAGQRHKGLPKVIREWLTSKYSSWQKHNKYRYAVEIPFSPPDLFARGAPPPGHEEGASQ